MAEDHRRPITVAFEQPALVAQQAAQAAQTAAAGQAMTGAATSITLFLVILLLVLVLAIAGVAFAWTWWQKRCPKLFIATKTPRTLRKSNL